MAPRKTTEPTAEEKGKALAADPKVLAGYELAKDASRRFSEMTALEAVRELARTDRSVMLMPAAGEKMTQADQEELNARRLGNAEALRAAQKRKDALERTALPPQRRATREGRQEA